MNNAIDLVKQEKIVSIIRLEQADQVEAVARSLYRAGIKIIEVTMNTPGALEAIRTINHMPEAIPSRCGNCPGCCLGKCGNPCRRQVFACPYLEYRDNQDGQPLRGAGHTWSDDAHGGAYCSRGWCQDGQGFSRPFTRTGLSPKT